MAAASVTVLSRPTRRISGNRERIDRSIVNAGSGPPDVHVTRSLAALALV